MEHTGAALGQWYVELPRRLMREQYLMEKYFPEFELRELSDGRLCWVGRFRSGESRAFRVLIVYPDDFPTRSPQVYPISENESESVKGAPHVFPDGSLCLGYPMFDSPDISAAKVAQGAFVWLTCFEHYIETGRFGDSPQPPPPDSVVLNIHNSTIGSLSVASIIKELDARVSSLSATGSESVAHAFATVSRAIQDSEGLPEKERASLLSQLEALVCQAQQPVSRRHSSVVKTLLTAIGASLSTAADAAQVWSTWGPAIARFFDLTP
jgi:hypothetical protein